MISNWHLRLGRKTVWQLWRLDVYLEEICGTLWSLLVVFSAFARERISRVGGMATAYGTFFLGAERVRHGQCMLRHSEDGVETIIRAKGSPGATESNVGQLSRIRGVEEMTRESYEKDRRRYH